MSDPPVAEKRTAPQTPRQNEEQNGPSPSTKPSARKRSRRAAPSNESPTRARSQQPGGTPGMLTLVEAADGSRVIGAGMPVRKDGKVVGRGDLVIR